MRVDLVELLRARAIRHPSRIMLLQSRCRSDLRIEVTGYPWWLEDPPPDRDQKITCHLEGITDGALDSDLIDADSCDEDLQAFDARPLCEQEWAKGIERDVYCSRPLPNALEVYASLHDFLRSVECPYTPAHYLNMGNSGHSTSSSRSRPRRLFSCVVVRKQSARQFAKLSNDPEPPSTSSEA